MSPQTEQIFAVCHFDSAARAQQAISELQQIGVNASAVHTISGEALQGTSGTQMRDQFLAAGVHADDAAHLEKELRSNGGVLAVVRTDGTNEAKVDEIFHRYGGHETDEYKSGQTPAAQNLKGSDAGTFQVVEEQLVVGKRAVTRGGMRVYSRIIETPVEQNISLTEEAVHVERTKVNRPISSADLDKMQHDQVLEVTAMGEEAVVGKQARVVEEVSIGKESSVHTDTVHDTVRRTDVRIEKIDPAVESYFESDYKKNYANSGQQYSSYAPAYEYGYTMASDPRYKGKSYQDVESNLRSDYESHNPGSTWEKMKGAVQTGWAKVTGH